MKPKKPDRFARMVEKLNQDCDGGCYPSDVVDLLLQVEREVWKQVHQRYTHHEYLSDPRTFSEWLEAKQQELT